MNARQKTIMYSHYNDLGWTNREITQFGTIDLTGKRPADVESERVNKEDYENRLREEEAARKKEEEEKED
jgi:hypothetical protein